MLTDQIPCCVSCRDACFTEEGVIDLDYRGICDACREREELLKILIEEDKRYGQHD